MRFNRLLLGVCLAVALISLGQAHSPSLNKFWAQWRERKLMMQTEEGQRFIRAYGRSWSPSIIPMLIRDVEDSDPMAREGVTMVYSLAVTCIPDRQGCKNMIARLQKSQDRDTSAIASDFQADIEDDERGELWPKGFKSGH